MSDFAPFVAAALRDKAMNDLLSENQRLREHVSLTQLVEITGTNGSPVYAKGMIHQGSYGNVGEKWNIDVTQQCACHLEQLGSLEIRLGGVPLLEESCILQTFCLPLDFIEGSFDERGMGLFDLFFEDDRRGVGDIQVKIGPFISSAMYKSVARDGDERHFSTADMLIRSLRSDNEMEVTFQSVGFIAAKMKRALEIQGVPAVNLEAEQAAEDEALRYMIAQAEAHGDIELAAALQGNERLRREQHESEK